MKSDLFATSSSSGSDSSSELTEASDDGLTATEDRNAELVASLYDRAVPRHALAKHDKALGLSKRAVDRLTEGLINARLALLRKKWSALQTAMKQLDSATHIVSSEKLMGFRLPIVARIYADAIKTIRDLSVSKRSLASDEARALATLRQKLPKTVDELPWYSNARVVHDNAVSDPQHRSFSPQWLSGEPGTRAEAALLDCIELALLTGNATVQLASVHMIELETTLGRLQNIFAWHGSFGQLPCDAESMTKLDLSHNYLSSIPPWFPGSVAWVKELDLRGNSIRVLPPSIRLCHSLESLHLPHRAPTNVLLLLEKAITLKDEPREPQASPAACFPSLSLLCLRSLVAVGSEAVDLLPVHLRHDPFEGSYHCAACKQRILMKDKHWLHTSLVERLTLFTPPYDPAYMRDHAQTSCVIGGQNWRFCAPCLYAHCCTFDCGCFICEKDRADSRAGRPVRWARRKETAYVEAMTKTYTHANDENS